MKTEMERAAIPLKSMMIGDVKTIRGVEVYRHSIDKWRIGPTGELATLDFATLRYMKART